MSSSADEYQDPEVSNDQPRGDGEARTTGPGSATGSTQDKEAPAVLQTAVAPAAGLPKTPLSAKSWFVPSVTGVAGLVIGLIVGGLGLGVVNAAVAAKEQKAQTAKQEAHQAELKKILPAAVRGCNADTRYAVISDSNRTLTIDHQGNKDYLGGVSTDALWCIIHSLHAPTSVTSHMEQTTSMDGRQTETWGDIEASWSYHPDRGMDTILKVLG